MKFFRRLAVLRQCVAIVKGIVYEIADQNAYQRHLATHGVAHSAEEWRRFSDGHWEGKARRGRCC
jgi:hypothetical protein